MEALQWITLSNPVALWWGFLVSISVVNILVYGWTLAYFRNKTVSRTKLLILAAGGAYVLGCAFRSFLPRADVQRICLFDTWFSSVFVGRSVATIAELGFVLQWALVLYAVAKSTGTELTRRIAILVVPLIFIAECFSWYAVVTTNYFGNTVEESLWTVTYSLIALGLLALLPRLQGHLRLSAVIAIFGSLAYVAFMATVDVPMYFHRWQADLVSGKEFFGLWGGFRDLNTRWIVTHDIADWRQEIPWMSLYFSFAVWVSLLLCYVPLAPREKR